MFDKDQWFAAMDEDTRRLLQDNDAMNALDAQQQVAVLYKACESLPEETKQQWREFNEALARNPDVTQGITDICRIAGEFSNGSDHSKEKLWEVILKVLSIIEGMRPVKNLNAVYRNLAILWGDDFNENPLSFQGALRRCGLTKEQALKMSPQDFLILLGESSKSGANGEDVLVALDLIFKERYDWPEGTAKKLPFEALRLSLEHALEYDAPDKPSVWKVT